MNVRVELQMDSLPTEADIEDASASARHLTNDRTSVSVYPIDDRPNTIVAEFTINRARQIDVVDRIGREFRFGAKKSIDLTISFPDAPFRLAQKLRQRYTRKQGQYLAFIYYYTKLNGYPPAEADMQKYFRTTPPAVHGMVVQLEKKSFVQKKPNEPRSIRLLLSREELPDLE